MNRFASHLRFGLPLAALFAVTVLAGSCNGPKNGAIPDFEVLPVPAAVERYPAGARWNLNTASPEPGVRLGEAGVALGLEDVEVSDRSSFAAGLEVPVLSWIGGSLGLDRQASLRLVSAGWQHRFVEDLSNVASHAVLFETIVADQFSFEVVEEHAASLDAGVMASQLAGGAEGDVELEVRSEGDSRYEVSSHRPLVIAIRVAKIEYAPPTKHRVGLDLSTAMRERPQDLPLGYTVKVQDVNPAAREVELVWSNANFPMRPPERVQLDPGNNLSHVVDAREVIASGDDPKAEGVDYVWDVLTVHLPGMGGSLAEAEIDVARQYSTLRVVPSGLSTR